MSRLNARRNVASPWLGVWWVSWLLMAFGDRAYYVVTDPDTLRILDFALSVALWLALTGLVVVVVGITEGHTAPTPIRTNSTVSEAFETLGPAQEAPQ
jgi:hypothetical protein